MPIHRIALFTLGLGFVFLCAAGCVMQRTVKDGDSVIAQVYVVKEPLIAQ